MPIRTDISPKHLLRIGLVGLFCTGAALWFLYDGLIGYPQWRDRGLDFVQFTEENPDMEELELVNAWKERAAERGWPTEKPLYKNTGKPITEDQITEQFYYAGAAGLIGAGFLIRLLRDKGRWIEAHDNGLRSNRGDDLQFSQITELNKKKWQSKGIARVRYQTNGSNKRMTLDDYIYDRDSTREILRLVEANIDHAKITNGKPEPPPKVAENAGDSASG